MHLKGSLSQIIAQRADLYYRGIMLIHHERFSFSVRERDIPAVLTLFYTEHTPGWKLYKNEYIKYAICTEKGL